jgi:hypothetical protein
MEQMFVKIKSDDPTLPDFISAKLGNRGAVYVPFSRFNQALADEIDVIVFFDSSDTAHGLHRILTGFLESKSERKMTIERGDRSLTIGSKTMPPETDFVREMFPETVAL